MDEFELKKVLSYDPETGNFTWLVPRRGPKLSNGRWALNSRGYILISFSGRRYLAHRLAWFYVYGNWPDTQLDHINRDKTDNRIANLRLATPSQNSANRTKSRSTSSKYKGVAWQKRENRWGAWIGVNRKRTYLGLFDSELEAAKAYDSAAEVFFNQFANLNLGETNDSRNCKP